MRYRDVFVWATAAALLFHLGFLVPVIAGPAMVGFLVCLYRLTWVPSKRWAFYLGTGLGFLLYAPQLHFFWGIFGPAAVPLWLILGLWVGLYLLLCRFAVTRWPKWGVLAIPFLWFGCEYIRSELYYLRFAWLTPGFALSAPPWQRWLVGGAYFFSFAVLLCVVLWHLAAYRRGAFRGALVVVVLAPFLPGVGEVLTRTDGPVVAGVQFEQEVNENRIVALLDRVLRRQPDVDLVVLSEYAFAADVPDTVKAWADRHDKYVIAGGKDLLPERNDFYNTAYVIGPDGKEVFRQVKSVPIQFFDDGLPAPGQQVWHSPWGKIGIAVCYDMSYSRVIDGLVEQGAQALIIPTFDSITWGAHQHVLHSRVTPIRAREYNIPIFRVASSGISQLVLADGTEIARVPFPGDGEMLAGAIRMAPQAKLPFDRYLAPMAVVAAIAVAAMWLWEQFFRFSFATVPVRGRRQPSGLKPQIAEH